MGNSSQGKEAAAGLCGLKEVSPQFVLWTYCLVRYLRILKRLGELVLILFSDLYLSSSAIQYFGNQVTSVKDKKKGQI